MSGPNNLQTTDRHVDHQGASRSRVRTHAIIVATVLTMIGGLLIGALN